MCLSFRCAFFSHLVEPQALVFARLHWSFGLIEGIMKKSTQSTPTFLCVKAILHFLPPPTSALCMHSWTKSVYLQTNELFFNRRSLLLHHVVEKPLDEKWNEKAWWNKMHQQMFPSSPALLPPSTLPHMPAFQTESACEKWILQIYIFSALPVTSAYFIFIHLCFYWMLFNSQSTFPHENNATRLSPIRNVGIFKNDLMKNILIKISIEKNVA